LIGALIAAGLNYYVRLRVARHTQMESERRLAFVHLVKVSEFVALDVFIKSYLDAIEKAFAEAFSKLRSSTGTYQLAHRLSAEFAKAIKDIPEDKVSELKQFSYVASMLEEFSESFRDFKIAPDQLARLPKDAVVAYSQFATHASSVRLGVRIWVDFFRDGSRSLLTAEVIHGQWLALELFFESAKQLRAALVAFGKIDREEASALLQRQLDNIRRNVRLSTEHQQKAKAAFQAAMQSAPEQPASDNPDAAQKK